MSVDIFSSKIIGLKNLASDVKGITLSVPKGFKFKPGQYVSLSVINKDGQRIRKPFSIANMPQGVNAFIEFCAKIIPSGVASEFIKKLKIGDEVELFGPAGKFVVDNSSFGKDLFFIAAGVGIAPFMSIIPDLLYHEFKKQIILLKSSRTEQDSLYEKELGELSRKYSNFKFYNVFSQPESWESNKGHVQEFIGKYLPENFNGNFYVCGFKDMVNDTKSRLLMNFGEDRIFTEKFD